MCSFPNKYLLLIALGCSLLALSLIAGDSPVKTWQLESRGNVLELQQDAGGASIVRLGPTGRDSVMESIPLILTSISGKPVRPGDLSVTNVAQSTPQDGVSAITAKLKHVTEPLEFIVTYSAWSDTGVLTCDVVLQNTGNQLIHVDRCSSLCLGLASIEADLRYLDGPSLSGTPGIERQLKTVELGNREF